MKRYSTCEIPCSTNKLDFHEHRIETGIGPEDLVRVVFVFVYFLATPGDHPADDGLVGHDRHRPEVERPPGLGPLACRHVHDVHLSQVSGVHDVLVALLERVGKGLLEGEHPDAVGVPHLEAADLF
jgi:hypothetical protein